MAGMEWVAAPSDSLDTVSPQTIKGRDRLLARFKANKSKAPQSSPKMRLDELLGDNLNEYNPSPIFELSPTLGNVNFTIPREVGDVTWDRRGPVFNTGWRPDQPLPRSEIDTYNQTRPTIPVPERDAWGGSDAPVDTAPVPGHGVNTAKQAKERVAQKYNKATKGDIWTKLSQFGLLLSPGGDDALVGIHKGRQQQAALELLGSEDAKWLTPLERMVLTQLSRLTVKTAKDADAVDQMDDDTTPVAGTTGTRSTGGGTRQTPLDKIFAMAEKSRVQALKYAEILANNGTISEADYWQVYNLLAGGMDAGVEPGTPGASREYLPADAAFEKEQAAIQGTRATTRKTVREGDEKAMDAAKKVADAIIMSGYTPERLQQLLTGGRAFIRQFQPGISDDVADLALNQLAGRRQDIQLEREKKQVDIDSSFATMTENLVRARTNIVKVINDVIIADRAYEKDQAQAELKRLELELTAQANQAAQDDRERTANRIALKNVMDRAWGYLELQTENVNKPGVSFTKEQIADAVKFSFNMYSSQLDPATKRDLEMQYGFGAVTAEEQQRYEATARAMGLDGGGVRSTKGRPGTPGAPGAIYRPEQRLLTPDDVQIPPPRPGEPRSLAAADKAARDALLQGQSAFNKGQRDTVIDADRRRVDVTDPKKWPIEKINQAFGPSVAASIAASRKRKGIVETPTTPPEPPTPKPVPPPVPTPTTPPEEKPLTILYGGERMDLDTFANTMATRHGIDPNRVQQKARQVKLDTLMRMGQLDPVVAREVLLAGRRAEIGGYDLTDPRHLSPLLETILSTPERRAQFASIFPNYFANQFRQEYGERTRNPLPPAQQPTGNLEQMAKHFGYGFETGIVLPNTLFMDRIIDLPPETDSTTMKVIDGALQMAGLGLRAVVDTQALRLAIPILMTRVPWVGKIVLKGLQRYANNLASDVRSGIRNTATGVERLLNKARGRSLAVQRRLPTKGTPSNYPIPPTSTIQRPFTGAR